MEVEAPLPFASLDFLYTPVADVAAQIAELTELLGARLVWAIERFGTRVAMVELASGPPGLVLAEHLHGERAVLVYRVPSLDDAMAALAERGLEAGPQLGFPYGPIHSFSTPGGQRIAVYELTRPEVAERLAGRRDF
jgi:hypothetical protein